MRNRFFIVRLPVVVLLMFSECVSHAQSQMFIVPKASPPTVEVRGELHVLRERTERLEARRKNQAALADAAQTELLQSGEQRLPSVLVEGVSDPADRPTMPKAKAISEGVARAFVAQDASAVRIKVLQERGLFPPDSARATCLNLQNVQCWVRHGGLF